MVPTLFAGLMAVASIASALPQTTTSTEKSCQQLGSGSQVGLYTITCGADRPGGDLSNAQADSFSACIPLCDQLAGCVGFAYTSGSGAGFCYFKSSLTTQVDAANVDVAVKSVTSSSVIASSALVTTPSASVTTPSALVTTPLASVTTPSASVATSSALVTIPSASVTTPTVSITTTAITSAVSTSTAGASCQQLGNGAQVGAYVTECQTDRPGGDLSNAQAASFSACFPLCDQLAGCVGFSYVGGSGAGTCYFKSDLTAESANQGVDSAVKRSALSSSSSSTSTTKSTTAVQVPTTTPAVQTTTPAAPTTSTGAVTTSSAAPVTTARSTTSSSISISPISISTGLPTTLSTTSRAATTTTTTTTRASTTSATPTASSTTGIFCTKYVFGFPVIVLCNTL